MKGNVHFIIDEAAILGRMEAIDNAVNIGRGYAIRCQFYYQSIGQLRHCFPDGRDVAFLSGCSQIFFGINDNTTADFVSTRLGEKTLVLQSGGHSRSISRQSAQGSTSGGSVSTSWSETDNWALQARRLCKPEELMVLPPRMAIAFMPSMPPISTYLIRDYEEPHLGKDSPGAKRIDLAICMAAIARLVISVFLAAALTAALLQSRAARSHRAAIPPVHHRSLPRSPYVPAR